MAVVIIDGTAYRAMCGRVAFGDYLQTSQGLLLVDGVVHIGGNTVFDCVRASEESVAWADGLLAATGATRVMELIEIDPSQSGRSS